MNNNYLSDIGKLDRVINLVRYDTATVDEYGKEATRTVSFNMPLFAAIAIRNNREKDIETKQTHVENPTFIIRYISTISVTDNIVYQGKAYDITDLEEVGRMKFIKVTCKLIV